MPMAVGRARWDSIGSGKRHLVTHEIVCSFIATPLMCGLYGELKRIRSSPCRDAFTSLAPTRQHWPCARSWLEWPPMRPGLWQGGKHQTPCRLASVTTNHPPSTIHQPPTTNHQPSTNHPPPTTNRQSSNRRLPIIQPPTANRQPPTTFTPGALLIHLGMTVYDLIYGTKPHRHASPQLASD